MLVVDNRLPDVPARGIDRHVLAGLYPYLALLEPKPRPDESAARRLQMPGVEQHVDRGIDRSAQALQQRPETDGVEPALRVRDEREHHEVLAALDPQHLRR